MTMRDFGPTPSNRVPGAPHVEWAAGADQRGQWWISCVCHVCGPASYWTRPCQHPENTQKWVEMYRKQHVHG